MIAGNKATFGGTLSFSTMCNVTVFNCSFASNIAKVMGGAISLTRHSTLSVSKSSFESTNQMLKSMIESVL